LITESSKLLAGKETTMEENNNVRSVENVRIEQLLEVEELERKLAPGGGSDTSTIHVDPRA
jgi:hypothetical protein